ncbi:MAG TPA: flagellar hook capping FlgD N-terminal domain-containing protein [Rhodospirillales bacterium]|nr:flagellar hook capping FlgD N-terminal domain-containing protein [Rhodospirillales bacterium]
MVVQGVSTATQAAAGKAAGAAQTLGSDLNRFLTLLVTQLQNQDPLDPLDTNEFTAQLVQFAGVEQQIQNNANLETLIDIGRASEVAAIVNVIGKRIEAGGTMLALNAGKAEAAYTLSEAAAETKLTVTDETGRVVYANKGKTEAGRHEFIWDGRDEDGRALADGAYTLKVTATRKDGSAIAVEQRTIGTVTAAATGDAGPILSLGAAEVPMAQVRSIGEAVAKTAI